MFLRPNNLKLLVSLLCELFWGLKKVTQRPSDFIAFFLVIFYGATAFGQGVEVVDFSGEKVTLAKPASRIIALAPHIVENLFSAGAESKIIGVVEHSDFPEAAKAIPVVGGYNSTNFEKIVAMKPDIVIAWQSGTPEHVYRRLAKFGIPVYLDEPKTLMDIARSIRDFGVLAGTAQIANAAAMKFEADLKKLFEERRKQAPTSKVKVFYEVWSEPLQTLNGEHIVSSIIEACGGINIFAQVTPIAPIVNMESLIKQNPEIILSGVSENNANWKRYWRKWPLIEAVKNDQLYQIEADHIHRHTVRILNGAKHICRIVREYSSS